MPQVLKLAGRELLLLALFQVRIEGDLIGEHLQLFVGEAEVHSGRLALVLLGGEGAVQKLDGRVEPGAQVRVYADKLGVLRAWVSVKEAVELLAVAMQVQDESDLSFLADLLDEILDRDDLGAA